MGREYNERRSSTEDLNRKKRQEEALSRVNISSPEDLKRKKRQEEALSMANTGDFRDMAVGIMGVEEAPQIQDPVAPQLSEPEQAKEVIQQAISVSPPKDVKKAEKAVDELQKQSPEKQASAFQKLQEKAENPDEAEGSDLLTLGLLSLAPVLVGALFSGSSGAIAGADAASKGIEGLEDERKKNVERADKSREAEAARMGEIEKQRESLVANSEEKKLDRASAEKIAGTTKQLALLSAEEARNDKAVEGLQKRLEGNPYTEMAGALSEIESLLPGEGKDIPGFGGTGFLPRFALSAEGKGLRQAVQTLENIILKARSGGTVSVPEADRLLKELGTAVGGDDEALRTGLGRVRQSLENNIRNAEVAKPEVTALFKERGGRLPSEILGQPKQASPAPGNLTPRQARILELRSKLGK